MTQQPYTYDSLSPNRRIFVDIAHKVIPDLQGSITRDEIQAIVDSSNGKLTYPQWLTANPAFRVNRGVYYIPSPTHNEYISNTIVEETDEEIWERIKNSYESMELLIEAVAANNTNSLVISGSPGIGKSFTVNKILKKINGGDYGFVKHSGYLKGTHLFRMLWENRNPGQVVVIDDCDKIFKDEDSLNLLKAALEIKPVRRLGWGSEKEFVDQDGEVIPRYFDYQGSIIFLTNKDITKMVESGDANSEHMAAIESRSLVLDLGIRTRREYLIKIKQTVQEGMLRDKGFLEQEENEILEFFIENQDNFREFSLRMIEKIASLYECHPKQWKKLVPAVCFKTSKHKRVSV